MAHEGERTQDAASERLTRLVLDTITSVHADFSFDTDRQAVFDRLLASLLAATESEYGFIGEALRTADGQPYLKTFAITNIAWNEDTRKFYAEHAPKGLEFFNLKSLFGEVLTSQAPVIANSPESDPRRTGIPSGHPPLRAFLGVPLLRFGKMIGMAGLANRAGGYDERVIASIQPLLVTSASLIEASQRDRARREAEERVRVLFEETQRTAAELERQNERLEREVGERRSAEEALRLQREALMAVSTPIIQVWDGVIAVPIIGSIDAGRAGRMMDKFLSEIARTRARHAILDLTGVEVVDDSTAQYLLGMIRAAELLGGRCLLSGISPDIAQVFVGLGIPLDGFRTFATLQHALREAIAGEGRRAPR
jgi:anti-anti-sigma factor